jgi:hypothetical protein
MLQVISPFISVWITQKTQVDFPPLNQPDNHIMMFPNPKFLVSLHVIILLAGVSASPIDIATGIEGMKHDFLLATSKVTEILSSTRRLGYRFRT